MDRDEKRAPRVDRTSRSPLAPALSLGGRETYASKLDKALSFSRPTGSFRVLTYEARFEL